MNWFNLVQGMSIAALLVLFVMLIPWVGRLIADFVEMLTSLKED